MLVRSGAFTEEQVLGMSVKRFFAYIEAEHVRRREERKAYVVDTLAAISSAFNNDLLASYLKSI